MQPQRGMGVEQLVRLRLQERWKKMTEVPSIHPLPLSAFNSVAFPTSGTTTGAVHFRPPPPAMVFQGIGNGCGMFHGPNLFPSYPSLIGYLSNVGFQFENSKELSNSIPNYIKCASDGCGICHKKKRINGGNNNVVEMIDAGRTLLSSGQVTEIMSVHRNGESSLTGYDTGSDPSHGQAVAPTGRPKRNRTKPARLED